jgi:hypothetical protein
VIRGRFGSTFQRESCVMRSTRTVFVRKETAETCGYGEFREDQQEPELLA